jgi:hypothetical protein
MHAAWVHAISPVSHHITPGVKAVRLETWQTYAVKAMFWTIGAFGEMLSMPKVVFTTQATLDEDSGGCSTAARSVMGGRQREKGRSQLLPMRKADNRDEDWWRQRHHHYGYYFANRHDAFDVADVAGRKPNGHRDSGWRVNCAYHLNGRCGRWSA